MPKTWLFHSIDRPNSAARDRRVPNLNQPAKESKMKREDGDSETHTELRKEKMSVANGQEHSRRATALQALDLRVKGLPWWGMVQIRATRPLGWQTAVCSEPGLIGRTWRGRANATFRFGRPWPFVCHEALENAWGD